MASDRRLIAVDCETDKAKYGRVPAPFIWGVYDGKNFRYFRDTADFVAWLATQNCIAYAHNGGKFDFMFLIQYITEGTKAQVIGGRIVKMNIGKCELRDSFSAIPAALKFFGKDEIDYDKMEASIREQHMEEIISYLKTDCVSLYELMTRYRTIAGKKTTIASNALTYSRKLKIDPGKTNHTYDKNMRPFFFGGRCQVFQPGIHRNIRIIDIHSAYPFAMTYDHPVGSERIHITPGQFRKLAREQRQRCFIRLRCFSNGAFPMRGKTDLQFPIAHGEYLVTGWEFVAAEDIGLISDIEFIDIVTLPSVINFTPYVTHWYDYKARHNKKTNPFEYEIGKRMMNALYGKLAQNPTRYFDYKIMPAGSLVCDYMDCEWNADKKKNVCKNCGETELDHGWLLAQEYGNIEIHRRSTLWKYEQKFGKAWEGHPIYNNVATGASITGFTRAHLLRAIHTVGIDNVIYCDTDSIICFASADLSKLSLSEKLGDWADEGTGSVGLFAGKKQYGIKLDNICRKFDMDQNHPKKVCKNCEHGERGHGNSPEIKIASKGARLYFPQIEALMRGETVQWHSDFPSFSIAGDARFVLRNIRATAKAIAPAV